MSPSHKKPSQLFVSVFCTQSGAYSTIRNSASSYLTTKYFADNFEYFLISSVCIESIEMTLNIRRKALRLLIYLPLV